LLAVVLTASLLFYLDAEFQSAAQHPLTFEVASVKPSTAGCPPECGLVRPLPGNRVYHAEGATLQSLMAIAYQVTDRQISGGPSWLIRRENRQESVMALVVDTGGSKMPVHDAEDKDYPLIGG
jgi:hypothetical protein